MKRSNGSMGGALLALVVVACGNEGDTSAIDAGNVVVDAGGADAGSADAGVVGCGDLDYSEVPACNECVAAECCDELLACTTGTECRALIDCYFACADGACQQVCIDAHPDGLAGSQAATACGKSSCRAACPFGVCESGLSTNDGACDACLSDQCCAEATNCAADDACLECLGTPSGAGCSTNARFQSFSSCSAGCDAEC